ncbi:MAG: O-antigen ligase family protein [Pseudomonadota bacterium]
MLTTCARLRERIPLINSWLLAATVFTIPGHVAPAYAFSAVMLILWVLEGRFREKLSAITANPVLWIVLGYLALFPLSQLWTDNRAWGWEMTGKEIFFFLFPLYLSVARREHIGLYIAVFITAVTLSEVLAYYNWFRIHLFPWLPEGIQNNKEDWDIAPFVNHIMYAPILAFGAYLLGHALLFTRMGLPKRLLFAFFMFTMSANLFISGGRAGQVAFLTMAGLLVFQRFAKRPLVAAALAVAVVSATFFAAYQSSDLFKHRVDLAVHEVTDYQDKVNSSVGLRINRAINSFHLFLENPILGVGAGDFPEAYERINAERSPGWNTGWNPHNQYMLMLVSTGLLGGAALLILLAAPPFLTRQPPDDLQRIRVALAILVAVICLSESYLVRSNTSLMFVLFSAILYARLNRAHHAS